jgi:GNAT superfamily N-acetyltransferase
VKTGDFSSVAVLLAEMDAFYGQSGRESSAVKIANMRRYLFGPAPSAYLLVAVSDATVVGIAAYSYLWPAGGTTRSVYLKDLFVAATHRRTGAGRLLFTALVDKARSEGCTRLDWTADLPNKEAQAFYASLGLTPNPTKLPYRLPL